MDSKVLSEPWVFQTENIFHLIKGFGFGFSVIVSLAFAMMPISVYLGWVINIIFNIPNFQIFKFSFMLDSKIPAGALGAKME